MLWRRPCSEEIWSSVEFGRIRVQSLYLPEYAHCHKHVWMVSTMLQYARMDASVHFGSSVLSKLLLFPRPPSLEEIWVWQSAEWRLRDFAAECTSDTRISMRSCLGPRR